MRRVTFCSTPTRITACPLCSSGPALTSVKFKCFNRSMRSALKSSCRSGFYGEFRPEFGALFGPTRGIRAGENLFALGFGFASAPSGSLRSPRLNADARRRRRSDQSFRFNQRKSTLSRSPRTRGLLLATRRGSLDQGRGLACVSLVLEAEQCRVSSAHYLRHHEAHVDPRIADRLGDRVAEPPADCRPRPAEWGWTKGRAPLFAPPLADFLPETGYSSMWRLCSRAPRLARSWRPTGSPWCSGRRSSSPRSTR